MGASILYAAAVIGIVGILAGILLGVASEKFKVKVDEKEIKVREALPGNNCGGCGYPGCDGLAAAIAKGEAAVNTCPVGGEEVGKKIAAIMGSEAGCLSGRWRSRSEENRRDCRWGDRQCQTCGTCEMCRNV